jgi:hypothetical protein
MGAIANFTPANGLHYPNHWPSVPDKRLPTPFGDLPIGNAANGLCGGMAFAVRDLFEADRQPPPAATNPLLGSAAFDFIVDRLFDSFHLPLGVVKFYEWMATPSRDAWWGMRGIAHRTLHDSLPLLRSSVDNGHPCPIGLVCVASENPADLGKNHQVLSYGYDDDGPATTIHLYDPNHPDQEVSLITTAAGDGATFRYSTGDHDVRGWFPMHYAPQDPSPLFAG